MPTIPTEKAFAWALLVHILQWNLYNQDTVGVQIGSGVLFHICRCNNILYIRGIEEEEEDGEMKE